MSSRLALQGPMKAIHMAGISSAGTNQVGLQTAPRVAKLRVANLRKV